MSQSSSGEDGRSNGSNNSGSAPSLKRLIVCCDGTWLDSDGSLQQGQIAPPSNVTRISRAIRSMSSDGIPQIVYYQAGVGSFGTRSDKTIQGISGYGLAEHVREAYTFIAMNWNDGDEIFLIGFSRGAFTARSVGGLISKLGVMTKAGLHTFPVVYEDFNHRYQRSWRSPQPDVPFRRKPPFADPYYVEEMQRLGYTTLGVRIKAVGVFDTVGSLGIPRIGWLGALGQQISSRLSDYTFYDTMLNDRYENAFQALALDEKRASFQPCVWEKPDRSRTNLVQVWFPGVHTNIGGGYNDQELANLTLAWMMGMLSPYLDMDMKYIFIQDRSNIEYYKSKGERIRPWSFGKIYNSEASYFQFGGAITRTPGDYYRINPRTGEQTREPLINTNEYIHASARSRFVLRGPGYGDKGAYDPKALRGYRIRYERVDGLMSPWFWEEQSPQAVLLPEAPLREVELMLLRGSPEIESYILEPPKPTRSRRR